MRGRAAVVLLLFLGGIRLVGLGGLSPGDELISPPPFPRVGRPFHPIPHPPRRLQGAVSFSSDAGGLVSVALPGVSPGASRRHASPAWGRNFLGSSPWPAPPLAPVYMLVVCFLSVYLRIVFGFSVILGGLILWFSCLGWVLCPSRIRILESSEL